MAVDTANTVAANVSQNFDQLTGRSPMVFPVWPLTANSRCFPRHLVVRTQTGSNA